MFTFDTTQVHHTKNDVGLFYTPSKELWFDVLFKGLFKYNYREECTTFQEVPVLIREPALEIMNYLKNADYSAPINKYLLCILLKSNFKLKKYQMVWNLKTALFLTNSKDGKFGYGKTMILYHIIHYAHAQNWIVFHVPYCKHKPLIYFIY